MPVAKQLDVLKELKPGSIITKEQLRKLQSLATDSLGMMSCTNSQILQVRRDNLAPQLSFNYRQLKNEVPDGSKLLFGDDLSKRMASIKATNKASKGVFNNDLRNKINNNNRFSKNYRGGSRRGKNRSQFKPNFKSNYSNQKGRN